MALKLKGKVVGFTDWIPGDIEIERRNTCAFALHSRLIVNERRLLFLRNPAGEFVRIVLHAGHSFVFALKEFWLLRRRFSKLTG